MAKLDPAQLTILRYPDPRLRKKARPVESFDDLLAALAARMFELMRAEEGIGLAAPQVGVNLRLFVSNVTGEPRDDQVFINPQLSELDEPGDSEEGCLSIPEVRGTVRRYMKCRITALNLAGRPVDLRAEMLAARCFQHECDHLDGILIIDRMSEADKIANRKKLKQLEADTPASTRRARAR